MTDVTDISQLLVFVRFIDDEMNINEELLRCVSMRGTTKGVDVYNAVVNALTDIAPLSKLSAVCTDGAPAMKGTGIGFVGQLHKNNFKVASFHCIIHQESLCAKSVKMSGTMATVIKVVNKIRGGHASLTHRQFKMFLEEFDAAYGDLKMYCEVRWLSRGECLLRFFILRKEVLDFLTQHVKNSEDLQEQMMQFDFLPNLAFLTDTTQWLNELKKKLQVKGQLIFDLVSAVDSFVRKMEYLKARLSENDISEFKRCSVILAELATFDFAPFPTQIESLLVDLKSRFQDFSEIRAFSKVFYNPLKCSIEDVPIEFRMEMIDMQSDLFLLAQNSIGL